jgi:hypothetical protein
MEPSSIAAFFQEKTRDPGRGAASRVNQSGAVVAGWAIKISHSFESSGSGK